MRLSKEKKFKKKKSNAISSRLNEEEENAEFKMRLYYFCDKHFPFEIPVDTEFVSFHPSICLEI